MRRSWCAAAAALVPAAVVAMLAGCQARPAPRSLLPTLPAQHSVYGDAVRLRLVSAPFPHPDREDGYLSEGVAYPASPHYSDSSVAVFVPRGYRPASPVNLVVFLHGWDSSIDDARVRFDLYRQFSQSGVQALLVIPELAWNAPDSFGGKLEDPGGFTRMVDELLTDLAAAGITRGTRPGSIVLAGHSGGFESIAMILAHGDLAANIREVMLFDAVFAWVRQFAAWIEKRDGRFVSVISAGGEETTVVNELMAVLTADHAAFATVPDSPQNDDRVRASRVTFLRSDADHYGVVVAHDQFRRLLAVSSVSGRR
jgi:hypothetical protein